MPLKLVPPREGRSPNYTIRGTYLGIAVDRSARTPKRTIAARRLSEIEGEIERGELSAVAEETFAGAVVRYIKGGGERRYLKPLLNHFGTMPLSRITQEAIDGTAAILHPPGISEVPSARNATINRQVHTPVSSVLKAGGYPIRLKRPKLPEGQTRWLTPEQAFRFLECDNPKLRRLAMFLLYTGCRVTEAALVEPEQVSLRDAMIYVGKTKNGEPRAVHLPPVVVAELADSPVYENGRYFGYRDRWEVYDDWNPAREAAGLPWLTPHVMCHTWATWMRRYAGMDLRGLLGTGRWRDLKSVLRYQHVVTSEESRAADLLPVENAWNQEGDIGKSKA